MLFPTIFDSSSLEQVSWFESLISLQYFSHNEKKPRLLPVKHLAAAIPTPCKKISVFAAKGKNLFQLDSPEPDTRKNDKPPQLVHTHKPERFTKASSYLLI